MADSIPENIYMNEKKKKRVISKKRGVKISPASKIKAVKADKNSDVICIIGMHRSGTSMITRLLNLCGLDLGPYDQLLPPNEINSAGYFENEKFSYGINDSLLAHLGGSWDTPPIFKEGWEKDPSLEQLAGKARDLIQTFSNSSRWGWKDPRSTILLPFWKMLIPNLRFVICIRSPLEVVRSLDKRYSMPIQRGAYIWYQYMKLAIRDTESCPRIFVFYEDFFKNATSEIDRLVDFCGLQKTNNPSVLYEAISDKLRHYRDETIVLLNEGNIKTEYKLFYIGLRALVTEGFAIFPSDDEREHSISTNISKFNKLIEQFHEEQLTAQLQSELTESKINIDILKAKADELESDRDGWRSHAQKLEKIVVEKEYHMKCLTDQTNELKRRIGNYEKSDDCKDISGQ